MLLKCLKLYFYSKINIFLFRLGCFTYGWTNPSNVKQVLEDFFFIAFLRVLQHKFLKTLQPTGRVARLDSNLTPDIKVFHQGTTAHILQSYWFLRNVCSEIFYHMRSVYQQSSGNLSQYCTRQARKEKCLCSPPWQVDLCFLPQWEHSVRNPPSALNTWHMIYCAC